MLYLSSQINHSIIFLFSLFVLTSCSKKPTKIREESVPVHYFMNNNKAEEDGLLFNPKTVRINSKKNVYVLDKKAHSINQYSEEGVFISKIHSEGQGPGDLLNIADFDIDDRDYLYVLEAGNKRVSIFDSTHKFLKQFKVRSEFEPNSIFVNAQKEIFINHPSLDRALLHIYNDDGEVIDSIGMVEPFENPPFKGINRFATSIFNRVYVRGNSKGETWVFYSERPICRKYNRGGELIVDKNLSEYDPVTENRLKSFVEKRLKKPATNPRAVKSTIFFQDFDFIHDDTLIVNMGGFFGEQNSTYFYLIDAKGNLLKNIVTVQDENIEDDYPVLLTRFGISKIGEGKRMIIASDPYHGVLNKIPLYFGNNNL